MTEQPPAVPCLKCCALVRPADLRVHEAWHAGLIELVVAAAVLKLMKGSGN